jgi:hypothetical protein
MDVSELRACKVIAQPRMTQRYKPKRQNKDKALTAEIKAVHSYYQAENGWNSS